MQSMSQLSGVSLDAAAFVERFPELFRHTSFRLELLPAYIAPNEAGPYAEWQAGRMPDPAWREPWSALVRDLGGQGKQLTRVHVVAEPLSDYERFELECAYPANVAAGEDVRILPRPVPWNEPPADFYLFDGRHVGLMDYDDDGRWLGVRLYGLAHPRRLLACRSWRDTAMRLSVPLHDYTSRRAAA
jgi:hypothetical protein